ncbi:MAG: hypothetical protein FDZ69_07440 [Deltaproteobacteria bacterium]|nr:MAG: hypothetical protein FDZ69_07440 [Deltaproteobacteria bacterium]
MSCEACAEAREIDGVVPECETGECPVVPMLQESARILGIRDLLVGLDGLVDAGTVCRLTDVDLDDLRLLAVVENLLRENRRGEGCQADHQG